MDWYFTALSALAKPVTLPLILFIPIIKIYESYRGKSYKPYMFWLLGFIVFTILVLSPWTIRNYFVFKKFVPIQSGAGAVIIQGSKEEYIDLDVKTLKRKYGQNFGIEKKDYLKVGIENHLKHLNDNTIDYVRFLIKKFFLSWYNTEGKQKNTIVLICQLPFLILRVSRIIIQIQEMDKKSRMVYSWYDFIHMCCANCVFSTY